MTLRICLIVNHANYTLLSRTQTQLQKNIRHIYLALPR